MTKEELEKTYPAVELAYPIAVASYDVALRRLDAMDGRLQTVLAFIVTVSAIVPSVAAGRGAHFRSAWFYAALAIFVVAIGFGTFARLRGRIKALSPDKAFNHWLHKSDWEFKKDMIAVAALDYRINVNLVQFKWMCAIVVMVLFFFQAVCLAAWVLGSF